MREAGSVVTTRTVDGALVSAPETPKKFSCTSLHCTHAQSSVPSNDRF